MQKSYTRETDVYSPVFICCLPTSHTVTSSLFNTLYLSTLPISLSHLPILPHRRTILNTRCTPLSLTTLPSSLPPSHTFLPSPLSPITPSPGLTPSLFTHYLTSPLLLTLLLFIRVAVDTPDPAVTKARQLVLQLSKLFRGHNPELQWSKECAPISEVTGLEWWGIHSIIHMWSRCLYYPRCL